MPILSRDDFFTRLRAKFGEPVSEEDVSLLEDITDSYNDLEASARDTTDWRSRYEELDASWRKRYTDRFFGKGDDVPPPEAEPEEKTELSFDDLFTERK